jgi:hypothetical protein
MPGIVPLGKLFFPDFFGGLEAQKNQVCRNAATFIFLSARLN